MLSRDHIAAFQYLKGAYRKAGEGLFTGACSDRTRGNGFKLKKRRFRFDVRQKFFTVRIVRHWTGSPEKLWMTPVSSRSEGTGEGDYFNSLLSTESHDNDQEAWLKTKLYMEWQWNYKRWSLWNFITSLLTQWCWKWILTWQKVSTTQCLTSQNHRI